MAARLGVFIGGLLWPSTIAPGVPSAEDISRMERAADKLKKAKRVKDLQLQAIAVTATRLSMPELELLPVNVTARRLAGLSGPGGTVTPTAVPSVATSTPTPTSGGSSSPRSRGIFSRLPWQQILLGALFGSRRGGAPSFSFSASPQTENLTRVQPQALPSGAVPPVIITGSSGTDLCETAPKRRRKPRKCLEWAQTRWSSGRYEGKSAGRKCVRRERK